MYKSQKQMFAEICRDIHRQMVKEKCRKQERKEKSVKLSKYIEKENGTLVPKPKIPAMLKGVQPRAGGYCATGQRPQVQSAKFKEIKDNIPVESKRVDPEDETLDFKLYQEYQDVSSYDHSNEENNIVEHFERLLLLMELIAKNPEKLKESTATSVIQFLESVKTPDGQLGPNAQGLVNYIYHLLEVHCGADNNKESESSSQDDTSSSNDGENYPNFDRSKFLSKINDKIKHVKEVKPICRNSSKRKCENGNLQMNQDLTKCVRAQYMKPNSTKYLLQHNSEIVNNESEKAKDENTLLNNSSTNSVYTTLVGQLKMKVLSQDLVQNKKETLPIDEEEISKIAIGDSQIVGEEIVQAYHEPTSRSISYNSMVIMNP